MNKPSIDTDSPESCVPDVVWALVEPLLPALWLPTGPREREVFAACACTLAHRGVPRPLPDWVNAVSAPLVKRRLQEYRVADLWGELRRAALERSPVNLTALVICRAAGLPYSVATADAREARTALNRHPESTP